MALSIGSARKADTLPRPIFVHRSLHAELRTWLLCQSALDQDQRAAGEEEDRRFFPEGAQPPSNWSTYDQENGSSEEPVHF
jgi:hypothetical protein